ncbi:PA2169 family four-helix-bundle protein [Gramella sp. GC03-9]|uniref:PA2169 family four-helix-bundle protein n=1 Tax=Christiangramia oceanisediminis TaxID=2920386 RepID=A0A9X2IA21_9FLAO|nr:PA2169 family four-helix-bundle protein [Gramella oceanisediminis]MCP9199553.1 PA2169 family four-helix-bundle protein [Gramella oceanisediminis]
MSYSDKIAGKLNELLEKNYDAEKGYKLAAEKVKREDLKRFFTQRAQERYDFGHELKSEIKNFGETPDKGSSLAADAHRSWMNLKASLSNDKDESVLEEAVRGEKKAVEEYEDVINESEIPVSTKQVLVKQKNGIVAALNEVKALEDQA